MTRAMARRARARGRCALGCARSRRRNGGERRARGEAGRVSVHGDTGAPGEARMCNEHGVLEAVCTKCNPALVPVFQAKGDWCAEHGFPESFCPICHPERGGRPAVDVADGRARRPTAPRCASRRKETAQIAGIEVVDRAARQPTAREVDRDRADRLRRRRASRRSTPRARRRRALARGRRRQRRCGAAPRSPSSRAPSVGAEQSRLQAAAARVRGRRGEPRRACSELHEEGIAAEREVAATAQQELDDGAAPSSTRPQAALGVVGAARGGRVAATRSPRRSRGVVTDAQRRRSARLVDAEEVLFEIVDTSTMWAELDVARGRRAARRARASGHAHGRRARRAQSSRARSTYVAPEIDPHTRTAKARVALANPDGAPAREHVRPRPDRARGARERRCSCRARRCSARATRSSSSCGSPSDVYEARRVEVGAGERRARRGRRPHRARRRGRHRRAASCSRPRRSRRASAPAAARSSSGRAC